jgi:glycosyltransferase involved in cell wall biosynthesis
MNEKVLVIVPVYNKRDNLDPLGKALFQALKPNGEDKVLFIDDGSTD